MEPSATNVVNLHIEIYPQLRTVAPGRQHQLLYRQDAAEAVKKTTLLVWPRPLRKSCRAGYGDGIRSEASR
jgi:hypothetical protein